LASRRGKRILSSLWAFVSLRLTWKSVADHPQVFGNSNSLPISLVISLSQTLRGLHWDKIPNDNDDEVGARGILYLLIFQQLGQLLRWSWGYNVLLAPAEKYTEEEGGTGSSAQLEQGRHLHTHDPEDDPRQPLVENIYDEEYDSSDNADDERTRVVNSPSASTTNKSSRSTSPKLASTSRAAPDLPATPTNGNGMPRQNGHLASFPQLDGQKDDESENGFKGVIKKVKGGFRSTKVRIGLFVSSNAEAVFAALPGPVQMILGKINSILSRFFAGLWEFMNPPLWAMLVAIVVASVPALQRLFFDEGTFIRNSVTRAIGQSGGVAVPLILVVLGGKF
jgi:predicted permease